MFSWCKNRLEITAKSVCIDVMQAWIAGTETPRYRHAIRQAIKLFLAGCAGILKPTKATEFAAYPLLTAAGTGSSTSANQAFQHFLELLGDDAWLDNATIARMDKIWVQSGLETLKWESIPFSARQIMTQLMAVHYADWFGLAGTGDQFNPQERWEWLSYMPVITCPCDMLMVMPTRLATEMNGNSSLFRGLNTTAELYTQLYGMEFPAGNNVNWSRESLGTVLLTFDTPWYPPSGEAMGELSELYDCEIRHYWISEDEGFSGYNCFDRGDHVDSGSWPEEVQELNRGENTRMLLVASEIATVTPCSVPAAQYGSIRA